MSAQDLAGKTAIVTGAGGAIGRAIALLLAERGARIVVNDLGTSLAGDGQAAQPAEETVALVTAAGGQAIASFDSVADWAGAKNAVELALHKFGSVDILVNNAGNVRYDAFQYSDPADFDALVKVHLYGSYYMARAVAPYFVAQKSGSYVHMTSSAGLIGMAGNAGYAAAKMGVVGLSRVIAIDMEPFGVRSNCVAPAAVSRMSPKRATPEDEARFAAKVRPEQTAPLVAYLASDAASHISGQIMGVRGNELYLYNQPRPIRTVHRENGWTADSIAEQVGPAWKSSLTPLEQTYHVFDWAAI